MPVTLTPAKPKAKVVKNAPAVNANPVEVLDPEKMELEDLVDEYGKLADTIGAIMANPTFAQFQLVEAELKKRLEAYEPDEIVKVAATDYVLEAGACSMEQRRITDPLKVLTMIGPEAFASIAKVGVADAEKYLVPEQFAAVVSTPGFTKNRKIKVAYKGKGKPTLVVA